MSRKKPDALPRTGGSFVRDDKGKLTKVDQTEAQQPNPTAKPAAKTTETED